MITESVALSPVETAFAHSPLLRTAPGLGSVHDGDEVAVLRSEVDTLSESLAIKFEQLTLIHGLSEHLEIHEESSEVCEQLLEDLLPCLDATRMLIELFADEEHQVLSQSYLACEEELDPQADPHTRTEEVDWLKIIADQCEGELVDSRHETTSTEESGVIVSNNASFARPPRGSAGLAKEDGQFLRCIVVPIKRRENVLGRMIAIRNVEREEFGTVEADLMRSMTLMLAVHWLNQRHFQQMQAMFEGTIHSLVSALDAKDAYTSGHSSRVAELSVELASHLGYEQQDLARIRMAGILHDIGKIGIEDSVLGKPGRLTEEEFEKIKQHPVLGYEILKGIRPFRNILPAVRHHHESWDGSGYPDGLVGEEIPRDAQIMAVADAFDAMTSDRPYRRGMPLEKVMSIFRDGRGKQWTSDVVDVLLAQSEEMDNHVKR